MPGYLRKFTRPLGLLLCLLTLGFFASRLAAQPAGLFLAYGWERLVLAGLAGLVLYLAVYFPLSYAFWRFLRLFGAEIAFSDSFPVSCVAQFAKYAPGNVAQYLGRHGMLRVMGIEHGALIGAAALEIIQALIGGALVAFGGLLFVGGPGSAGASLGNAVIAAALLAAGLFALLWFLRSSLVSHWSFTQPLRDMKFDFRRLAPILALQIAGYLLIGVAFYTVCAILLYPAGPNFAVALAAVTVSWIAGFVTPGAPAGLGIREAVLLGALAPVTGEGPALAVIALYRGTNMLGDLIAFLYGLLCRKYRSNIPSPNTRP